MKFLLTIISEIILNLMTLAYNTQNYAILKKLLSTSMNLNGTDSKIIYNSKIWHPKLFGANATNYVKYIFPDSNSEDLFSTLSRQSFLKVNFLFDCYSTKFERPNVCYPAFLVYEDYTPNDIVSRLLSEVEDQSLVNCVKEVFSINDIDEFLQLVVQRLKDISSWKSARLHDYDFDLNPIIQRIEEYLGI